MNHSPTGLIDWVVRKGGLEPPWGEPHEILSLARLPIPPLSPEGVGEPWRNRTSNLVIKSHLLCQLS